MNLPRWLLGIFFFYILAFFSHALFLQKTVFGDGIFYYSWIRSVVVDHDINFANEYSHFAVTTPITPTNQLGNKHPIGAPLFWLPWYGQARTLLGGSGYELSYQLLIGFLSVLAAFSGLILLYRLLMQSFSPAVSLLSMTSIALATNLLFYGAVDPVNSHAISFFAAVVFLSFLYSKNVSPFVTGCALGFCALVRPQDAILGLLTIPSLKRSHLLRLKSVIPLLLGSMLIFSPQLFVWYALYGSPFTSPYLAGGESFAWWSPNFLNVLFSPTNGLFLWTPVTLLTLIGFLCWKDKRRAWSIGVVVMEIAIVGSWSTWWQGASYSGRMLVSTLPILSFGLAALYTRLVRAGLNGRSVILTIIGPLSAMNAILIVRFLLQT
ncbi:MAG: hypothetical protein AAB557_02865 [Patescibacteria group bacterium]